MARVAAMTTPIMISAGVGLADGFLARGDINDPVRAQEQLRQWSFWGELAGVGGGLVINQQARTPFQETLAMSLIVSSAALLARRGGVMVAESMETGTALARATGRQPIGYAAAQAFQPLALPAPAGVRVGAQFEPTGAEQQATARQNAFV